MRRRWNKSKDTERNRQRMASKSINLYKILIKGGNEK